MNIKFEAYSSFGVPFKVEGDEYIWNFPNEAPSQEAIDAKIAELEKTQYQRNRLQEYPSIQELVVALYDEEDKQAIIEKRAEVKAKYPKPE